MIIICIISLENSIRRCIQKSTNIKHKTIKCSDTPVFGNIQMFINIIHGFPNENPYALWNTKMFIYRGVLILICVASSKATNDWTKFCFVFYLHYIQEIKKVVYKKSWNMPAKFDSILRNQHVIFFINACTRKGVLYSIRLTRVFFAAFLDVVEKM